MLSLILFGSQEEVGKMFNVEDSIRTGGGESQVPPDERRDYRLRLTEILQVDGAPNARPRVRTVVRMDFDDSSEAMAALVRFAPLAHGPLSIDMTFLNSIDCKMLLQNRLEILDRENHIIHEYSSLDDEKRTGRAFIGGRLDEAREASQESELTPFSERFKAAVSAKYPHLRLNEIERGYWFSEGEEFRGAGLDGRTIVIRCVRGAYGWIQFDDGDLKPFGRPGEPSLAQLVLGTRYVGDWYLNVSYTGMPSYPKRMRDLPNVWIQSDGEYAYEILDSAGTIIQTEAGFRGLRDANDCADRQDRLLSESL